MTSNYTNFIFRQESPALKCTQLREILNELSEYDVIGIDEGQFYSDVNFLLIYLIVS
jgi:hypothetical protein